MSKRKQSAIIDSYVSLETEKTLYENTLRASGLKKIRKNLEGTKKRRRRKTKKDNTYYRNNYSLGLSDNNIALSTNKNSSVTINNMNINRLSTLFTKIRNIAKLADIINSINSFHPQNLQEKIVRNIYLYILDMHADRPWVFSKELIDTYTAADYQNKFWSYLFESFLGQHPDVVLQWSEAVSDSCKKAGKTFKLDLRLVVLNDDSCTGELAKKATVKKIFKDKLKSIVISKCHFNTFLKKVPYICPNNIPLIKMPIIQIAGFNGKLSILSLPRKKEYQLVDVCSFCFPKSLQQIKSGSLENLVNFLSTIDSMMDNLRKLYHNNNTNDENAIDEILTGSSSKKRLDLNAWITEATFEEEEEEEEEEEGEEEEEEEDEEGDED